MFFWKIPLIVWTVTKYCIGHKINPFLKIIKTSPFINLWHFWSQLDDFYKRHIYLEALNVLIGKVLITLLKDMGHHHIFYQTQVTITTVRKSYLLTFSSDIIFSSHPDWSSPCLNCNISVPLMMNFSNILLLPIKGGNY